MGDNGFQTILVASVASYGKVWFKLFYLLKDEVNLLEVVVESGFNQNICYSSKKQFQQLNYAQKIVSIREHNPFPVMLCKFLKKCSLVQTIMRLLHIL